MSVAERGDDRDQTSSSRGNFVGRVSAGVAAATAAAAGGWAAPVFADRQDMLYSYIHRDVRTTLGFPT